MVPVVAARDAARGHTYACSVWSSAVHGAVDQGAAAAAWLDAFLGTTGLRLVYMDPSHTRRAAPAKFIARSPHRFVARGASEAGDFLFDLCDAHLVGVAHDRDDEALFSAHGHADMGEVLVDDVGAVDLGVDRRDFLERMDHGSGEKAHEAQFDAMLFLEQLLVGNCADP